MRDPSWNPTGQRRDPLRSALAQAVKELIWRCAVRYRPARKPICLYASRRSGSTLLMEVICVNARVMFSDQPFAAYASSSANLNLLTLFPYGQIACPDQQEEALLRAYLESLLSGRVRANVPWKFWTPEFHFRNDRILLKITDAKAMIDWIDSHFEVHTLVSTRHPIAQAVSVSELGWLPTGKGFLKNSRFVDRWLSHGLESYSWDVYQKGSELEKRVLDWTLENLPLLSLMPERKDWLYVSYEDLVGNTVPAVHYLADALHLKDRRRMVARVARPSRSVRRESGADKKEFVRLHDRRRVIDGWRKEVDERQQRACFRVLERFGIRLYRPDSSRPDYSCLGREDVFRQPA